MEQRGLDQNGAAEHGAAERDHVDEILDQWATVRPGVDVSGMAIIGRIGRLNLALRPLLDEVFTRYGLESWEFDVLATLLRNGAPHRLTPGQLLDSTMITSGAMTNRLKRLEERGFIERAPSPTDGRQVLVTLTDEGRRTVDAALVDHAANEADLIGLLEPADRDQLGDLLRAFALALAAADRASREDG